MEMANIQESKSKSKEIMHYQINYSSDDSGYISETNKIDKNKVEILQVQNRHLQDENEKLQNELKEMRKEQEHLKEEIKRKDVKIIELNKKVECDMEKAIKLFEKSINSERELSSKMHNKKLQLIGKNLTKMVDNKTINEAVTSLGINMNATTLRNGEIKTLVLIGEYFSQIEKYEEGIQEQIFLRHVDKSVINLLGGISAIENKSLKEIKDKVFNMTVEIESIERLIHLGSLDWKGDTEPLVYRMELEKLYNCYNYDKNLQLSFNEILKNNITNNFSESKKDIFCTMFKKDPEEAMRKICEKYNYKGRNYFFSEPEPSKTIISRVCQENKVGDKEHDILRKKRCVLFGLKNDGDDYKVMAEILENMEISDVNIKSVYRVQCKQEIKPLKVEFCSVEEKKIFWRKYLQQKDEYIFDVKPDHSLRYRIKYKMLKDTIKRLNRNLINREEIYVIRNMKIVKKRL